MCRVRDLLVKLGRTAEARAEFAQAAALTSNDRERTLFEARAANLTTEEDDRQG